MDSVKQATTELPRLKPDLLFCDIHLGDGTSFSIFEKIEVSAPVIFTTAYDAYAIRAFKLNSIDYLLKPVNETELAAAIKKFDLLNQKSAARDLSVLLQSIHKPEYQKRLLVQSGARLVSLEISEIHFFTASEKIVIAITASNKQYPVNYTLDKLESLLDPGLFFRINRKIILQHKAIAGMKAYSRGRTLIELSPAMKEEALVSIDRGDDFRLWLNR
jgi:DNA-binding LytR/AlgR family response regulator